MTHSVCHDSSLKLAPLFSHLFRSFGVERAKQQHVHVHERESAGVTLVSGHQPQGAPGSRRGLSPPASAAAATSPPTAVEGGWPT